MRRILVAGPLVLTAGGLVIALSFLTRQPLDVRIAAAALGFAMVFGGAGFTVWCMHRILRFEVSVVVRTDAVVVQSAAGDDAVPWAELREVRWDPAAGALVLEREGGEAVVVARLFARATGAEVAARIRQHARRVALGLPN